MATPKYNNLDGFASQGEKASDLVNQLIHTLTPGLPDEVQCTNLSIRKTGNGEMVINANLKLTKYIGGFRS